MDPFNVGKQEAGFGAVHRAEPEKRAELRIPCSAAVQWGYFNKKDRYEAQMFNHSKGGVYFESAVTPAPGSTILLRLEKRPDSCPLGGPCSWPRTIGLGEVKWCRQISEGGVPHYAVGVKYHVPV